MRRVSAHLSERGPVRAINADAVLADDEHGFYALADGIGSTPLSARASRFAVEAAYEVFLQASRSTAIPDIDLADLTRTVFDRFQARFAAEQRTPATTLTIVLIGALSIRYVSIGDSPLFLIQDGRVALLTRDHTAVDQGRVITNFSEMKSQQGSNVLMNTLGAVRPLPIAYADITPGADCCLILCSDGLMEICTQDDLVAVGGTDPTPGGILADIRARARTMRPPDNFSVLAISLFVGDA